MPRSGDFRTWHRAQVEEYRNREYAIYKLYAEALRSVLEQACAQVAPLAIVQARAKTVSSFAGKVVRKWPARTDPLRQFTDLCGARVVARTQGEARRVREFIEGRVRNPAEDRLENRFAILEGFDAGARLGATEFGYGSSHYVVLMTRFSFQGMQLPAALGDPESLLHEIGSRRAEIQVRTMMQHAWADAMHDRVYKARPTVPDAWKHMAARQAALLEHADQEFTRIVDEFDGLLEHYDDYMTDDEIDAEIEMLATILQAEPEAANKPALALKLAGLCRTRRAWPRIVEDLTPYAAADGSPRGDLERAIQVELGRALCMANGPGSSGYRMGLEYLERVARPGEAEIPGPAGMNVRPDPVRAGALAQLASLRESGGQPDREAVSLVQAASALDPRNPYHLVAALEHEAVWRRDLMALRPLVPRIQEAARTCSAHADLGIELPRAHFALGKCNLFLQRCFDSLAAYAKAIEKSTPEQIADEIESVARLHRALVNPPCELDWITYLLRLAHISKLRQEGESAERVRAAVQARQLPAIPGERLEAPVVIVAGGTDPALQALVEAYRKHLFAAFEGFAGTVISGGTQAGIAGLVGELARRESGLTAVTYLPEHLPQDGPKDERYAKHYRSGGSQFSPLEPLVTWTHLLASGMRPADVHVLGINGGPIAAFEYQLALAMGAVVGLVEGSGRAASDLLPDVEFWSAGRLLRLPDDKMTLRAFISPGKMELPPEGLEAAARQAHEVYVEETRRQQAGVDIQPWDKLPKNLQDSNSDQVLYSAKILAAIKCRVGALEPGHTDPSFGPDEIETMAEMEHGRWVVERLKTGWRYGEKKDRERRISPYLVGWDRLSEEVKEYDRETARNYPKVLRKAELGVYR